MASSPDAVSIHWIGGSLAQGEHERSPGKGQRQCGNLGSRNVRVVRQRCRPRLVALKLGHGLGRLTMAVTLPRRLGPEQSPLWTTSASPAVTMPPTHFSTRSTIIRTGRSGKSTATPSLPRSNRGKCSTFPTARSFFLRAIPYSRRMPPESRSSTPSAASVSP